MTDATSSVQSLDGAEDDMAAVPVGQASQATCGWREALLQQAAVRDQATQGLPEIMAHYMRLQHQQSCDAAAHEVPGPAFSRWQAAPPATAAREAPVTVMGHQVSSASSATKPHQPVDLAKWPPEKLFEVCKRLRSDLASSKKEVEAKEKLIQERDEELREREHAHIEVCRRATQLSRENTALREELAKLKALTGMAAPAS
mmetsp:Transcript_19732/g.35751  ORF Transcript_19732/g.35751 Transcript_19732/m.35751 type:complete len:201 (+) Transcript_19732:77-679(+)